MRSLPFLSAAGYFDCVVIDPPFITPECWKLYAATAKLILAPGGKVIASTIAENAPLMKELLGASPQRFQPSIPHLVYQAREPIRTPSHPIFEFAKIGVRQ